jgi:hypothetical protein
MADEAAGARGFEARPFPALTAAQRLHLDVHGFVVVEGDTVIETL